MIHFFRRIRQGLIHQDRIGKYLLYAIGEILLVVVGILLALQINNWNQDRQKAEKERYYLNSVKTSIALSQHELNRVIEDAELISSCADTLFLMLARNETASLKGVFLDSLLLTASDYSLISLNDGGVQEILNTGSMDILKDETIRVHLASWNDRLDKIRKYEEETEYLAVQYQDYLMQYMDMKRFESRELAEEGMVIPAKKQQLLTDHILTNYLVKIVGSHNAMHRRYVEEKSVMDSLTVLIDNYLGND